MKYRKLLAFAAAMLILTSGCAFIPKEVSIQEVKPESSAAEQTEVPKNTLNHYEGMTAAEITATLTLEEKAYQMQIPAIYSCNAKDMKKTNYGSILSTFGLVTQTPNAWKGIITNYQKNALESDSPIPFLYGQDSVHGVNYAVNTVIFPHNINIGAANDPELTYKMGLAVADEMKMTRMIWNYAPCVAVSSDPRWGRTYESYSSDPEIVKSLGGQFTQGQLDGGVIVCTKHYIGDGSVVFGTGEVKDGTDRLIDRGNAVLTKEEIDAQLAIYKDQIDRGAQSIMISHSALNG
ncbi:MAG: beta-N-acetylhexosaminidase, partial [Oscillospiraceae bacterium]|nr:beta-N-acetylhexosaminidase [Oscillospiraceae bacterium]